MADYTIGKGKLLFKAVNTNGYLDLGNCPDFKVSVKTEKKEHYSSRTGLQTKDMEVITKITATGSFTLDEPNVDNLNLFIMGDGATDTTQTSGTASASSVTAYLNKWVEVGKMNISSVVVKAATPTAWAQTTAYLQGAFVAKVSANAYRYECTTAGTSSSSEPTWPTTVGGTVVDGTVTWTCRKLTYDLTTDYLLDTSAGLIKAVEGGAIADAQALKLDYSYATTTTSQSNSATETTVLGHIFFVGDPPIGKIIDVKGYGSLQPNGTFDLISDDWLKFAFDVEFLTHADYDGLFEVIDRGTIT